MIKRSCQSYSKSFETFLFLINGAAPAEARYKISGVRKLGVAVLRSFFKQNKTLENKFDHALIFTNIKVKDNECNKNILV